MVSTDDKIRVSWRELLEAAVTQPGLIHEAYSRFWNYSFGNQILALLQCKARGIQPGPIATFQRWKDLGRHVRKGEKALTLCMPVTIKCREWDRSRQEEGLTSGEPSQESGTRTVFVFKRNWFVLSQTEGAEFDLPPIPHWQKEQALQALGIFEEPFNLLDGNCQGYATKTGRVAVSPVAVLPHKTLFHEVAHLILGHLGDEGSERLTDGENLPRSIREAEAEAVALLCCESLGLAGADFARGYVQEWLGPDELPERSAQRILKATDTILRAGWVEPSQTLTPSTLKSDSE